MNNKIITSQIDLLNFATIRANWYIDNGYDINNLKDSVDALESVLAVFKGIIKSNDTFAPSLSHCAD